MSLFLALHLNCTGNVTVLRQRLCTCRLYHDAAPELYDSYKSPIVGELTVLKENSTKIVAFVG